MKKGILTGVFCLLIVAVTGQTNQPVAMGKWRTHLAYNSVSQIAQSSNNIYAVSDGALFSVSKDDADMQFYSKMSGLSDANIVKIEYDKTNNQLLIIYANGNIDIMHSVGVNNIPDLRIKQMSTSKGINDVYFQGNFAYLSCDFGIMLLNMTRKEIADTYIIGPNSTEVKVLSTTIYNNKIYAVTANTVYNADADNRNLVNFEYWKATTGLPGSGNFQSIGTFNGELYLLRGGTLYKKDGNGNWSNPLSSNKTKIKISESDLFAYSETQLYRISTGSNVGETNFSGMVSIQDVEYDIENNHYWFAGNEKGIVVYDGIEIMVHKPLGPATNFAVNMTFSGQKLFVVPGGRVTASSSRPGAVMIYENNIWQNILGMELPANPEYTGLDFADIAINPTDDQHFFVTSIGSGLYEFKNNAFHAFYNYKNSTIETHANVPTNPVNYTWLWGCTFDDTGNLWLLNIGASKPVKIMLGTGEWSEWSYPGIDNISQRLNKIHIQKTNSRRKWITSDYSPRGLLVVDDGGTITEQNDDIYRWFPSFPDSDGNVLSPGRIYSIAEDKNGVIWLGTNLGPLLFYNTSNIFNSDYTCSRIKIPRNDGTGLADYLLENEAVKAIAVDGANRKWIGTASSGVYLMSENGQETIHHFTSRNSPLLSDDVSSISINPVTGEVFFATANGLVSLQSDAAEASDAFKDVYAYPNPVRENYNGIITITGLVENTQVKITDITGNLIYQTISNGSIATWDGKNVYGNRVNTGIYLAICANEDGTQSAITKIMVIN
jgi:hypothetical protein